MESNALDFSKYPIRIHWPNVHLPSYLQEYVIHHTPHNTYTRKQTRELTSARCAATHCEYIREATVRSTDRGISLSKSRNSTFKEATATSFPTYYRFTSKQSMHLIRVTIIYESFCSSISAEQEVHLIRHLRNCKRYGLYALTVLHFKLTAITAAQAHININMEFYPVIRMSINNQLTSTEMLRSGRNVSTVNYFSV